VLAAATRALPGNFPYPRPVSRGTFWLLGQRCPSKQMTDTIASSIGDGFLHGHQNTDAMHESFEKYIVSWKRLQC
jgi:hypothetical protein